MEIVSFLEWKCHSGCLNLYHLGQWGSEPELRSSFHWNYSMITFWFVTGSPNRKKKSCPMDHAAAYHEAGQEECFVFIEEDLKWKFGVCVCLLVLVCTLSLFPWGMLNCCSKYLERVSGLRLRLSKIIHLRLALSWSRKYFSGTVRESKGLSQLTALAEVVLTLPWTLLEAWAEFQICGKTWMQVSVVLPQRW